MASKQNGKSDVKEVSSQVVLKNPANGVEKTWKLDSGDIRKLRHVFLSKASSPVTMLTDSLPVWEKKLGRASEHSEAAKSVIVTLTWVEGKRTSTAVCTIGGIDEKFVQAKKHADLDAEWNDPVNVTVIGEDSEPEMEGAVVNPLEELLG